MNKIFVRLKLSIKRNISRLLQGFPAAGSSSNHLERARISLAKGEFAPALEYYRLAKDDDAWNLEPRIGAALCYVQLNQRDEALKVLLEASVDFGDHDAILGLITRCKLHEQSWADIEIYWRKWRKSYSQHLTSDFYQATGEILVALLKSSTEKQDFLESLLADLVFQDDRSVSSTSNPAICAILFHQHEYDREFYLKLRGFIKLFLINKTRKPTACTAAMLLTFGLVNKEERATLLREYFHEFEIYSHWAFVLMGSSWNAVWDASLQENTESIPIVQEILKNSIREPGLLGVDQVYKIIFLAHVCCQELIPRLIECAEKMLADKVELGSYFNDFKYITQKYRSHKLKDGANLGPFDNRPLKIAVCVSGQLRGWEQAFRSWQNIGLEDHEVTYFVHTWKDTGAGSPIPPKDERSLPPLFQKQFRQIWSEFGSEGMRARYPNFFSLWPQTGVEVDVGDLKRVYGTEYVCIEDDSVEPFSNMSNSEKMYYKISECHKAVENHGASFDLIIRIRPDLEFFENNKLDWSHIHRECMSRSVVFCEAYATYFFPNIGLCMPDQFAIASPDIMRGYASAYDMTKSQSGIGDLRLNNFPKEFIAHRNVAYSTVYNGATVEAVGLPCRFSPALKPSVDAIAKAIRQDVVGRNDSFDQLLLGTL